MELCGSSRNSFFSFCHWSQQWWIVVVHTYVINEGRNVLGRVFLDVFFGTILANMKKPPKAKHKDTGTKTQKTSKTTAQPMNQGKRDETSCCRGQV